ncbi:hypothetical protein ZIOFF_016291 [Zingiber officinale]|uniref:TFIIB-type domain-containing protein n=1 Tax=Zingiber officinale TaxID=94328 RepID=A0A8J5I1H5_ZINOF|nr:hypothetical protein ZIOFF_016291 [Zingiber officinale]
MGDAYCSDCKKSTEVVFDHSAGDTVCSECGLVLEAHSIDETSEWRTFANESGDNDPVRVGGPSNPLLADGGLSTVISKPNGAQGDFLSSSLGRWQNRGSNPDRTLILAFKTIATMADRFVMTARAMCPNKESFISIISRGVDLTATIEALQTDAAISVLLLGFPGGHDLAYLLVAYGFLGFWSSIILILLGLVATIKAVEGDTITGTDIVHCQRWQWRMLKVVLVARADTHAIKGARAVDGGTVIGAAEATCCVTGKCSCSAHCFLLPFKDRANEIYKKVEDLKSVKGRNQDAILAACLYIACRQEDKPRTVKDITDKIFTIRLEICSVANGATKKEIGRAKEFIVKQLEVEMGQSMEMGTIHAGDFLRRFCSHLGMTNQAVKAAQEAVQKSEELDIRRSPISVAAAIIYMITQLSDEKKPLKDISLATGVAEGTIKNSYKDLYPYASRIIPTFYAKEEDLKNLCSP